MFSVHTARRYLKTQRSPPDHFGIVFQENSGREITWICFVINLLCMADYCVALFTDSPLLLYTSVEQQLRSRQFLHYLSEMYKEGMLQQVLLNLKSGQCAFNVKGLKSQLAGGYLQGRMKNWTRELVLECLLVGISFVSLNIPRVRPQVVFFNSSKVSLLCKYTNAPSQTSPLCRSFPSIMVL